MSLRGEGLSLCAQLMAERLAGLQLQQRSLEQSQEQSSDVTEAGEDGMGFGGAAVGASGVRVNNGTATPSADGGISSGTLMYSSRTTGVGVDAVVGIDSGGLLFAGALAARLGVPVVRVRKVKVRVPFRPTAAAAAGNAGMGGGHGGAEREGDALADAAAAAAAGIPPPRLVSPPYGSSFIRRAAGEATAGQGMGKDRERPGKGSAMPADQGMESARMGATWNQEGQQLEEAGEQWRLQQRLAVWGEDMFPGQRVVVVDDLLASGATLAAAVRLLSGPGGAGAEVVCVMVLAELPQHGGRQVVQGCLGSSSEVVVESLLQYEGL